jgi:hypothetical protein
MSLQGYKLAFMYVHLQSYPIIITHIIVDCIQIFDIPRDVE